MKSWQILLKSSLVSCLTYLRRQLVRRAIPLYGLIKEMHGKWMIRERYRVNCTGRFPLPNFICRPLLRERVWRYYGLEIVLMEWQIGERVIFPERAFMCGAVEGVQPRKATTCWRKVSDEQGECDFRSCKDFHLVLLYCYQKKFFLVGCQFDFYGSFMMFDAYLDPINVI